MAKQKKSVLRIFFMRGLGALLPTILTISIIVVSLRFVSDYMATPINLAIHHFLVETKVGRGFLEKYGGVELDRANLKYRVKPDTDWTSFKKDRQVLRGALNDAFPPIFGFLVAILIVFALGFFVASYLGRKIFSRFEQFLSKFPVIQVIYPYARQLVDFFFKEKKMEFSTVVAFEYPRKGIWAIGFMTGRGLKQLHDETKEKLVSVFIPSSPAPMTGYTVFLPHKDLIALDMEVEEAFRLVITGGVVVPARQIVAHDAKIQPVILEGPKREPDKP